MSSDLNKAQYQRTSLTAINAAMNSASTVVSTIVDCFFESYEIASLSNSTTNSEIDFLSMWSSA